MKGLEQLSGFLWTGIMFGIDIFSLFDDDNAYKLHDYENRFDYLNIKIKTPCVYFKNYVPNQISIWHQNFVV